MSKNTFDTVANQELWAHFRFSIIGSLLAAPPEKGELRGILEDLAEKTWRDPITGLPRKVAASTIERWFYQARKERDPVKILKTKRREDAGKSRMLPAELKQALQQQYRLHPSWSCQLHLDNLKILAKEFSELGSVPSYNTVRRYMRDNNLTKRRRIIKKDSVGAAIAADRLETREVRSFEMDHVNALWHLDFHHGSRKILGRDGKWRKPMMLAIIDDRSRLICHAQWYLDETAETLVHGFMQALQKRALPRSLMSDNGAAMTSGEFTGGLARLGILHQTTLPYSPYQNAKQEVLWAQVEGRLMAMLDGVEEITLQQLNEATIAWVEFEYQRKLHSEIATTPLAHYLKGPDVGRACPDTELLRQAFCIQVTRRQRKSDGSFSLDGRRFEVPSCYRDLTVLSLRYATWDLSRVLMVDPHTQTVLCTIYPQDKSANASGIRRALEPKPQTNLVLPENTNIKPGIAPLLKDLIAQYAATGLPPAYIPKGETE